MRVVILTQYYPPETGAPQNRLHALAKSLYQAEHDVTVLTAMPNYPAMRIHEEYRRKWSMTEMIDNIRVLRSWIYVKDSKSLVYRLLNYFSFVFSSAWVATFKLGKQDVLILESPPLFLALSARWICFTRGIKMVTNISDLWPESAVELGLVKNKMMISMATALENHMYRRSHLISGQTQGIVDHIRSRFPNKEYVWFPNGADLSLFDPSTSPVDLSKKVNIPEGVTVCLYGGIHGHAQGLDVIIQAASMLRSEQGVHFLFVGDGPVKEELINAAEALDLENVHFIPSVSRNEMRALIAAVDICLVPLKDSPLFRGAIPSKIFECLAMEKAVVLGVEGEAERLFAQQGECVIAVKPEDHQQLAEAIIELHRNPEKRLQLGKNGRKYVTEYFDREKVNASFIQQLEAI